MFIIFRRDKSAAENKFFALFVSKGMYGIVRKLRTKIIYTVKHYFKTFRV